MSRDDWLELTVLERKKYNDLTEVQDVTRQLAECLDRSDKVSARMLVAMREDPIRRLAEVDNAEKLRLSTFPQEDRERAEALRRGEPPQEDGERIFSEQAGKTRRLLEQVLALDRRTNMRMAGEQSFYSQRD